MRLIIVRHGETSGNKKKILQGWKNIPLNKMGKSQAKMIGLRLKKEGIEHAYVSDLKRTVQTAKEIIKHHPEAKIIYTPKIRERNMGIYEGCHWGTMNKEAEKRGLTWNTFKPKKGESIEQVTKRAERFLDAISKKHKGKTVLIVSHGSFIKRMLKVLLNFNDKYNKRYSHGNTAVTIIKINKGKKHKVLRLACTKHLKSGKKKN